MASIVAAVILLVLTRSKHVTAQVDPTFAASHSCNATCQAYTDTGLAFEASQHATTNDPFYTVSSNFTPDSQPGTILSIEAVTNLTNYTVPSGLTMSRFQYTTTNLNGTAVPASAYILWPYTPYIPSNSNSSSESKIPLVAWAHGTTGSGASCSPSNYQALQYNFIVPFPLALAGFTFVAPDYAGLGVSHFANGTRIPHAWLSSPSQANDLANAVLAARSAFPALSQDFVVMGHSEGGAASYAFAERQVHSPVSGYLGAISIGPLATPIKQVEAAFADPQDKFLQSTFSYQDMLIAAVTADYPAYNYSGFTDLGLKRWQILMEYGGCLPTSILLFADVNLATMVGQPGWYQDTTVQTWAARISSGGRPLVGPLLVIAGEDDTAVALETVEGAFNASSALSQNANQSMDLAVYQGLDHFPTIDGAHAKWMNWIKARFDGEVIASDGLHTSTFIEGPRLAGTKQSTLPNWLVQLPGPLDVWKTAL
ncbi:hypothetical protein LTR10_021381 [Elasticomyces elasticus]|uniref:AB hydrolase-1 domain-containing protein n=1 Tax=Exophiala sideris TaxID=1016849 RepID=A0ABR0JGU9_9EURO|nr:hypothetical protein LTR10_021381 [Elasticomyces elasticus]KAK5033399.1 hypothetical protein LTS07_003702 [Exophiala sideris]KAK5042106.1 hypothetical protein LTR13_001912 [Exophiala sideris]KAK5063943.1 hypothetical protein LTR69_003710 [Exophiala sideris]KAK5185374.1 hypothetical protein LTR44_002363 [Eurotiomycetes sp. CCFEE 6388]